MPQTYPVSAIAALLKLSERRIQQLVKDGILPRPIKSQYDPIACVHSYIDYLKKLITGSGELSLTDERTRLTKYQADLAELELKKAQGVLINTRHAMQLWGEVVTSSRQRLLGLPTRLAPVLATCQTIPEVKAKLDLVIYEILNEFTNPDLQGVSEGIERGDSHTQSLQTAPQVHRKRVGGRKKKALPGK